MKRLVYDFSNLLRSDKMAHGISNADITEYCSDINQTHQRILNERADKVLGFYDLPNQDIHDLIETATELQERFDNFVVLGIGGSALGNKALYSALANSKQLKKKVIVLDNVDPHMLHQVLDSLDLKKTVFNVITKSGTTAETIAVFLICLDILKKEFPDSYRDHIVITTDAEKGFLRELIKKEGYKSFAVPDNVGGRFSVLTPVGLLSSAFAGIDVKELLKGAAAMRAHCEEPNIFLNPAYLNGLLHHIFYRKGRNISVMMPYSNDLYDLADWYRQLWAESLGKRYNLAGSEIMVGQTPVKALGTTDQHSQIQLYVEGPEDKIITFLEVKEFAYDYEIPDLYPQEESFSYLNNKKLSTLLNTEKIATEIALNNAGRPNCSIIFPALKEFHLGEFIMMFEVQTIFTGYLLNINPLDQPGVEAGKQATMAMMGKENLQELKREIERHIEDKEKFGAKI
ncbi:MAG: glucose-6-phosphate isomerase [Candidatus Cloacimonetes bacterium]|nr:glucose-6-phosphate isomerase [Candidatus Cloacimonadota bacterium]